MLRKVEINDQAEVHSGPLLQRQTFGTWKAVRRLRKPSGGFKIKLTGSPRWLVLSFELGIDLSMIHIAIVLMISLM